MDRDTECSEAWLVYGAAEAAPRLLAMMQFLLDDIVAQDGGVRNGGVRSVKMGARALRIGYGGFELRVIACDSPPAAHDLTGATRPHASDGRARPDLTRIRLGRLLHGEARSVHLIVRSMTHEPAMTPEAARETLFALTRQHLATLIEVAPPAVILWQSQGLLLTATELLKSDPAALSRPGDPETRFDPSVVRPPPQRRTRADIHPMRPVPQTRGQRADLRSAQRLFGVPDLAHPRPVPRLEPAQSRLITAMRAPEPGASHHHGAPRLPAMAVTLMWAVLLPQLVDVLLPSL